MKLRTSDLTTLPCGCSPSELRFFDEDGEELEGVLEFELVPGGARLMERLQIGDRPTLKERFGQFRAQCRHSKPYTNGHALELEP